MTNKQVIKDMFDQQFNKEDIRNYILLEKDEFNTEPKVYWKWVIVSVVLIMILCLPVLLNDEEFSSGSSPFQILENDTNIYVNKVENVGAAKLDVHDEIVEKNNYYMIPYIDTLANIQIPEDFDSEQYYRLFGKNTLNNSYDQFLNFEFWYQNSKNGRHICIAFSDDHKPIRDYHFSEEGSQKSQINNVELIIYQYENLYMTEFIYEGIYFDIETNDITLEEFTSLLQSIIKE